MNGRLFFNCTRINSLAYYNHFILNYGQQPLIFILKSKKVNFFNYYNLIFTLIEKSHTFKFLCSTLQKMSNKGQLWLKIFDFPM